MEAVSGGLVKAWWRPDARWQPQAVSSRLDDVQVRFEHVEPQQPIVIRRLVLRRNAELFVIRATIIIEFAALRRARMAGRIAT